jgi:hypothetical protein
LLKRIESTNKTINTTSRTPLSSSLARSLDVDEHEVKMMCDDKYYIRTLVEFEIRDGGRGYIVFEGAVISKSKYLVNNITCVLHNNESGTREKLHIRLFSQTSSTDPSHLYWHDDDDVDGCDQVHRREGHTSVALIRFDFICVSATTQS